MAELQLEQGYVDRALSIYDELARKDPSNSTYARRRAWLARMVTPAPRRGRAQPIERAPKPAPAAKRARRHTLSGVGGGVEGEPSAQDAPCDRAAHVIRVDRIVQVR